MTDQLLEISGISKTFAGQRALADVSLTVRAGEVHAIVGQNGSGKSTLIKTLAGYHEPDPGGTIVARGELHFIHQDLALVEELSTVENLALSRGRGRASLLPTQRRREGRRAEAVLAGFGAGHDVHLPIGRLSRAEQTLVAIARALDAWTSDRNVIVLDEPTAALHHEEADKLFSAVRHLAAGGTGVIFVSHRLDEVVELADRVTVLRDGRVVGERARGDYGQADLIRMMTGSEVDLPTRDGRTVPGDVVLDVRGLRAGPVRDVDLQVRAGEIVGVTGLVGSGREHLAALVFGAERRAAGTVIAGDRVLRPGDPRAAIAAGVAFVPADRQARGALLSMTATENLTLADLRSLTGRAGRLSSRAERREARDWIDRVGVRPAEPDRELALLSGGNQQKVVVARGLRIVPGVLLLDEPTQGVDVAAKATVHRLILDAARAGTGVLVASTDTRELVDLCDRVLVVRDGLVAAEVGRDRLTEGRLAREAFDVTDEAVAPALAETTPGGTRG